MVVGIDLGTSFSSMACVRDGRAVIVRDEDDQEKTPSVVYYGQDETLVGNEAVNVLVDARGDEDVQARVIASVKRNLLSPPRIALPGGRTVTPVDVAGEILSKLRRDAQRAGSGDGEVTQAVITCPAMFDGEHATAVVEAASCAGLDEVRILEEPVAAAMAFEHEGGHIGRSVCVFDWGGGTVDCALVVRDEGEDRFYLALEPEGDLRCGGDDLDQLLYAHFDAQARRELDRPIASHEDGVDVDFLRTCRRHKESLSKRRHASFSTVLQGGDRFSSTIDRAEFEDLIAAQVERTVRITVNMAERAREAGYPVDTVLLVGGSSQLPLVRRRIGEELGLEPQSWGHRDVAVALGAAYHAGALWGSSKAADAPAERYRRSVRLVWSGGRLADEGARRLEGVAEELQIDAGVAAQIERDVMGRTKEEHLDPGPRGGNAGAAHAASEPAVHTGQAGGAAADLVRRAAALRDKRRFEEASATYDRALEVAPDTADALTGRGETKLAMHRLDEALSNFDDALKKSPGFARALVGRARVHSRRYRLTDSFGDLEQALAADPNLAEAFIARGWAHRRSWDLQSAVGDFERALASESLSAEAMAGRGSARLALGRAQDATEDFDRALELDATCVAALVGKAETLWSSARDEPTAAPGRAPSPIEGLARFARQRTPDAVAALERARGAGSASVRGLVQRAMPPRASTEDDAAALVDRALDVDPGDPDALVLRGRLRAQGDDPDGAAGDLDAALAANADCVPAMLARARLAIETGHPDEAVPDLDRALELAPFWADVSVARGVAHAATGQDEAAIEDFGRALASSQALRACPLCEVHVMRGRSLLRGGRLPEATADFTTAVSLDSRCVGALVARARAHVEAGNPAAALADLRRAAELAGPESSTAALKAAALVALAEAAQGGQQHRALLATAVLADGWRPKPQVAQALAEAVDEDDVLVALCRCARPPDPLRHVTVLISTKRLVMCRQSKLGNLDVRWLALEAIDEVTPEANGFTVISHANDMTIRLNAFSAGIDLLGADVRLDGADDVRELVSALAPGHES